VVVDSFRLTLAISALALFKLSASLLKPPQPVFEKLAYLLQTDFGEPYWRELQNFLTNYLPPVRHAG